VNLAHHTEPVYTETDKATAAVLSVLVYFDGFDHPLLLSELVLFAHREQLTPERCLKTIEVLLQRSIISRSGDFVFLAGRDELVESRKQRNARADAMEDKAQRFSKLISRFPFVRSVSISGSLSKGTMDVNGDIDYFIITAPRRLWVCRSLLILYKKVFLLNSRKHFCVNYFIDTEHLLIPDFNLFTATEISFIRPMYGKKVHQQFLLENNWISKFYPNKNGFHAGHELADEKPGWLKRACEKIFSGTFGEWIDTRLFRITLKRWKKKFKHISDDQFDLNFRSRKSVSKHHPNGFQYKVEERYTAGMNALAEKYNLVTDPVFRINAE
jgi:hypothetical protein